jgi:hypothetical protein
MQVVLGLAHILCIAPSAHAQGHSCCSGGDRLRQAYCPGVVPQLRPQQAAAGRRGGACPGEPQAISAGGSAVNGLVCIPASFWYPPKVVKLRSACSHLAIARNASLSQDISRHSCAADAAALAAWQPATAASIRRIAVQSLGRSSAAGGSHSTDVAAPPAAPGNRGCAGGAAEQGADAWPHGAAEAAGVVRAVHALKCATRRSRCVAMVTVPAGALPPRAAQLASHTLSASRTSQDFTCVLMCCTQVPELTCLPVRALCSTPCASKGSKGGRHPP